MIRSLEKSESDAAEMTARLGSAAKPARDLTYRLYHTCEQEKYAKEAQDCNALAKSRPEISRLAGKILTPQAQPSEVDKAV